MRIAVLALVAIVVLTSMCVSQTQEAGQELRDTVQEVADAQEKLQEAAEEAASGIAMQPLVIDGPMEISTVQCSLRGLEGKVVVIHAPGCAECPHVIDKIEEYERELGTPVEYIDQEEDSARLSALMITVPDKVYLPAVIIDCGIYTGNMGDRFYKESMEAL